MAKRFSKEFIRFASKIRNSSIQWNDFYEGNRKHTRATKETLMTKLGLDYSLEKDHIYFEHYIKYMRDTVIDYLNDSAPRFGPINETTYKQISYDMFLGKVAGHPPGIIMFWADNINRYYVPKLDELFNLMCDNDSNALNGVIKHMKFYQDTLDKLPRFDVSVGLLDATKNYANKYQQKNGKVLTIPNVNAKLPATVTCSVCGLKTDANTPYCKHCGERIK